MSAVAASETAMSAVANSAIGRNAVIASEYYDTYMKEDTMCIAKLAVGFANLESAGYSSMAGVAADSTAMTAVAASSTAMTAVAASSTAMTAVAVSAIARSKIEASATATGALGNSPLRKTYMDPSDGWNTDTIRTGKGFLISACQAKGATAKVTYDGTEVVVNNTTVTVNKFFLNSLTYYTYWTNSNLIYIPIN